MTDRVETIEITDEHLVRETLAGDISAFGTLVERHWKMVAALAMTRISDAAEADDVAQESFLKAYSQLRKLRHPARFGGWLAKITSQECTNVVRRSVRHRAALTRQVTRSEEPATMPAYSSNPGLSERQIHLVRHTVSELPEKFQRLIVMRFVSGLSAVQIAEQLGKRPGTVRVWLHRAYKMLRKDLTPLFEEVQS